MSSRFYVGKLAPAALLSIILVALAAFAQHGQIVWSDQERPLEQQLQGLRQLPDDVRARTTRDLAITIRQLPASSNKLQLAVSLADLSTEGDLGHEVLQQVADTLADALRKSPPPQSGSKPAPEYDELAQLVRYEHVNASLDTPEFKAAMADLEAQDEARQRADFTLNDLQGRSWRLRDLRGKVVLVNFWATWCPPCRKEMPDLDALYREYKERGLVVLAISDEDAGKVAKYVAHRKVSYPILLDPGRKVSQEFSVEGIPRSFVYDRDGRMVAQAIDMRTRNQFLGMLAQTGLK